MRQPTAKQPAIQFPPTPQHPDVVNSELIYLLELLRALNRAREEAVAVQGAGDVGKTLAFTKADERIYEFLIKGARQWIEELGPLSTVSQRLLLQEFIRSLERLP